MFVCVPPYLPLCVLCGSTETAWHPATSNCPSLGVLAVMGPFPERDSRGDWTKTSTGCLGTLQDWQQHTRVRQEHSTLLNSSACCFKSTAFPSVRAQRAGVVTTLETGRSCVRTSCPMSRTNYTMFSWTAYNEYIIPLPSCESWGFCSFLHDLSASHSLGQNESDTHGPLALNTCQWSCCSFVVDYFHCSLFD